MLKRIILLEVAMRGKSRGKGEFLRPFPPIRTTFIKWPGWDGPRPLLSFVLKVLAGKDPGMMRQQLTFAQRKPQTPPFGIYEHHTEPDSIKCAEISMVTTMRRLADLWIDSGKSPSDSDVDTPADRNVEYQSPDDGVSIYGWTRQCLINELPLFVGMRRDGTQGVQERYPAFENDAVQTCHLGGPLKAYGLRMAMYWFMKLLDSPYSRHLARCDECKTYFAYERAPKRTIKNGVFCPNCPGSGSVKRTKNLRARQHAAMIDAAATVWGEWRFSRNHPDQREWVVKQVNRECGTGKQRQWVSRNLKAILEKVEGL
jgi:hypothetical protein